MSTWMSLNGQYVAERTVKRARFDALDECYQFGGVFVHPVHVTAYPTGQFPYAGDAAILLQRMDDRPAPLGGPAEEGAGRLEVQRLALVGARRGARLPKVLNFKFRMAGVTRFT